jgi:membrane protease YdiL (CAAX protease family)
MMEGFRRIEIVEWVATFLGVAAAALILGSQGAAPVKPPVSIAEIRDLEQASKLLDAQRSMPTEVRAAIGISEDEDEERLAVVRDLTRRVRQGGLSPELLLIAASLAAIENEQDLALEALDLMADHPQALTRYADSVNSLAALARHKHVPHETALQTQLDSIRASEWLQMRVVSRIHAQEDRPTDASLTRRSAQALAAGFVERFSLILSAAITLGFLGLLLVIFWPLVRRGLSSQGIVGLGSIPSPFLVASTQRVFVSWFFAFLVLGLVLSAVGDVVQADEGFQALAICIQTLCQGIVAVLLIARLGRPSEDRLPLNIPLRIGFGSGVRGLPGLAVWTLGGLSVGLVAVASASALSMMFGGGQTESQPALELFAGLRDPASQLMVGLSVIVMAPAFEEILFRGFLYRNLRDLIQPVPAMLVTGLLFGLVHLDAALILPLSALGAVLCLAYEKSGSLLVPMAIHSLWNTAQILVVIIVAEG